MKIKPGSNDHKRILAKIRFGKITERLDTYSINVGSENFIIKYIPCEVPEGIFFPEFNDGSITCEKWFKKINAYNQGRLQAIIIRIHSKDGFDYKIIEKYGENLLITDAFPEYNLVDLFPEHYIRINSINSPIYQ